LFKTVAISTLKQTFVYTINLASSTAKLAPSAFAIATTATGSAGDGGATVRADSRSRRSIVKRIRVLLDSIASNVLDGFR
jgi:hypothetical protein